MHMYSIINFTAQFNDVESVPLVALTGTRIHVSIVHVKKQGSTKSISQGVYAQLQRAVLFP